QGELHESQRRRPRVSWAARAFTGVMTGLLTFAVLQLFSPPTTFSPLAAAAVTAAIVTLLPRIRWITTVLVLCSSLMSPNVARDAFAAVLFAACLPIPLLLPRAPGTWSLPAVAPALAYLGAGATYPAVAGQATTWGRRAALGAIGWLWIALAEAAVHSPLL